MTLRIVWVAVLILMQTCMQVALFMVSMHHGLVWCPS